MVSTMTDSSELQRMARLVDINRQHLEEINQQIESIEAVQLEHADAKKALEELAKGSSGHIPLVAPLPSFTMTRTLNSPPGSRISRGLDRIHPSIMHFD